MTTEIQNRFYKATLLACLNPENKNESGGLNWYSVVAQVFDYLVVNDEYSVADYNSNISTATKKAAERINFWEENGCV